MGISGAKYWMKRCSIVPLKSVPLFVFCKEIHLHPLFINSFTVPFFAINIIFISFSSSFYLVL